MAYLLTYIYFTLVFSTMLHLGLGLSRLTLVSRVAQASAVTPGTLVLTHGAALQQSLQALHTAPKLDMRVSGNLAQHGCLMLICCQDQVIHLVEDFCLEKLKLYSRGPGLLGSAMTQKKRRQDPGQEKAKEDRRRKRLAKALKKMEKKERQPKPLSECEVFWGTNLLKRTILC